MLCADCGCLVDQGIRVVPCGTAGCCCLDLPIRQAQPLDAMAEQIRSAFATKNLDAFGQLLADDARWGDDDHPNRCRSRSDVIATFRRVLGEEVYLARTGTYASGIDQLVQAELLRSAPSHDAYQIATDTSGAVVASPDCDSLDGSTSAAPTSTTSVSAPAPALGAACAAAVDTVTSAQQSYLDATGAYASNVATLVKKGYLAADPSSAGYTVKTTKTGVVTSDPDCANISDVACNTAVSQVQAAQQARLAQTGKYGSSVAQLVNNGYLAADPSTDAYKIKTTNKGLVTSTPDCSTLA